MKEGDQLVPRDSAAYREFVRLYRLARTLRPSTGDRWSGDLAATPGESWGGFEPLTGDIRLSGPQVVRQLANLPAATAAERAEVLATVLHEATHASMASDAPNEPNAVRTNHTLGLMEGFAEVRAMEDFELFAQLAGFGELELPEPTYPGVYAATVSLLSQASGTRLSREALVDECCQGPAVMHFDQLADGVLRNRLADVVPFREEHRRSVRAALIGAMVHPGWPILKHRPRETGEKVAEEVRGKLNARVDEIGRHYRANRTKVFPGGSPNAAADRERVVGRPTKASTSPGHAKPGNTGPGNTHPGQAHPEMRFLGGQAGAAGATRYRPLLGDGARGRGGVVERGSGPERG